MYNSYLFMLSDILGRLWSQWIILKEDMGARKEKVTARLNKRVGKEAVMMHELSQIFLPKKETFTKLCIKKQPLK